MQHDASARSVRRFALRAAHCVERDKYILDVDDRLNAVPERSSKALQKPQRTPKDSLPAVVHVVIDEADLWSGPDRRKGHRDFGKPRPGAATFSEGQKHGGNRMPIDGCRNLTRLPCHQWIKAIL